MALQKTWLGTLSLGTAPTAKSNILADRTLSKCEGLVFVCADAAFTGNISLLASPKADDVIANFLPVWVDGSQVKLLANRVQVETKCRGFEAIAITTDGTEAAGRTVDVYALIDIGL